MVPHGIGSAHLQAVDSPALCLGAYLDGWGRDLPSPFTSHLYRIEMTRWAAGIPEDMEVATKFCGRFRPR